MAETTKRTITLLLIVLTTLPFVFIVKHPASWAISAENAPSLAHYLSSVLGYIGIGLLLWMYILGTRSIVGLYFRDLSWTLKIHKWLGTYGVLFVFLHPFLSAYVYGENLLTYWIAPRLSGEFQQHVTYGRIGFLALLIVWVTSALIREKISYRPWKYIHYLSYIALPLGILHVREIGVSQGLAWVDFYFYSFIVVYLVITALRARHLVGFGKVDFEIAEHKQLSDDVHLIKLVHPQKRIAIRTGQYVYLQRSLLSEEHPFSVIDFDNETGEISVAYKVFGSFTKKLALMTAGEHVLIDGPYGVFTEEIIVDTETPAVFMAGGIGITPFVKHVMNRRQKENTWVFYSNRYQRTAMFRAYLKQLLGSRYVDVLSKESTPGRQNDERGYVSKEIISKYISDPLACRYFICGPEAMMETSKHALLELGVPSTQIHLEEFSF
jgi:3-phenylpropionate/trans-cinnamate dioxygenase ferredoxin reductase subunit